jgi:hypothetical protein
MTNLSCSVLSGVPRSAASVLRRDSSDALNVAAESNRFAMASLPLDQDGDQRCPPRAASMRSGLGIVRIASTS